MSYSNYEVRQLAERARARIEMDERYVMETEEAYATKKHFRIHQIIVDVVREFYGKVVQDIVDRVKKMLSIE